MADDKLPRPPRRCTHEQFYVEYLPALWQNLAGDLTWPDYAYDLSFVITDAATFGLRYDAGAVTGSEGAPDAPLAEIACDEISWKLAVQDLFGRAIRRTNKRIDQVRREMRGSAENLAPLLQPQALRKYPGNIEIGFTDDAGDRSSFRISLAGGSGPTVRVEAGEDDLWALLECGGEFVSLLKSRAQLDGDVGYLFKLARFFEGK